MENPGYGVKDGAYFVPMTDKNGETGSKPGEQDSVRKALVGFLVEEVLVPLKKYFVTSARLVAHPRRFATDIVDGRIGVRDSLKYYVIATAIAASAAAILDVDTFNVGLQGVLDQLFIMFLIYVGALLGAGIAHLPFSLAGGRGRYHQALISLLYPSGLFYPVIVAVVAIQQSLKVPAEVIGLLSLPLFLLAPVYWGLLLRVVYGLSAVKTFLVLLAVMILFGIPASFVLNSLSRVDRDIYIARYDREYFLLDLNLTYQDVFGICSGGDPIVDSPTSYRLAGTVLLDNGEIEAARRYFDEGLDRDPNDPDLYSVRGAALFESREYQLSIQDLDQVIRQRIGNPSDYFNRGISYLMLGLYDDAISDFETVVALDRQDVQAQQLLARARSRGPAPSRKELVTIAPTSTRERFSPEIQRRIETLEILC